MPDTVRLTVDLAHLPPLPPARRAELRALAELPADAIDFSDQPPLTEAFWARAQPNPFYRPRKASTTVRLDADVLAWLKSGGQGYQTRLNALLRDAMLRERGGAQAPG